MGHIVLGVTGGIAAYKAAELVRLLTKQGHEVRVVMSAAAHNFITPLTFQALSGNPVHAALLDADAEAGMGHIALARWADLILIAPASANIMAKLAAGLADDLLSTLVLASSQAPALAPAMNQAMWRNAATQANLALLTQRGVKFWGPAAGEQACGDQGPGRMLEPEQIAAHVAQYFGQSCALANKQVLVTAGPTREALDPVRYISNFSSGKMGFALATAARDAGAKVILVAGPTALAPPPGVELVQVSSALQMLQACQRCLADTDILIAAAAVADYRARDIASEKIKKQNGQNQCSLELEENPDILASLARQKPAMFSVGFAAETENLEQYARQKLQRKNIHVVIANDVANPQIGFNSDENQVTVITEKECIELPQQPKIQLAHSLIKLLAERYREFANRTGSGEEE